MAIRELQNKKVLITGSASGIGRAAAMAFARCGAHIIATDINADALKQVQADIEALGAVCTIHQLDVSNNSAMQVFAEHLYTTLGPLDVLINNAGIGYLGQFLQSDLAHWQRVIDINLMGVVHGCYHFLPQMIRAGVTCHVLNVASVAGIYPSPTMGAYAASKHEAYYRAKGCEPELVAEAMVRAVQKGHDLVLVGPFAKLIFHLKRFSLGLIRRVILSDARKIGYL
ncbi:MAG: oxidoreductase [Pseudomonas sp.]|nr:oxidoreductase [Pseudomonas sp.]